MKTRLFFDIGCPVCKKVKQLSPATHSKALKAPWCCLKCRHRRAGKKNRKPGIELVGTLPKSCPVCGERHIRRSSVCSSTCAGRQRRDKDYFAGYMATAIGWQKKQCQACFKILKKGYHIHHVFGHPDHSWLVVLCAGCHETVSKLARRNLSDEDLELLIAFSMMQRLKVRVRISIQRL